MGKLQLKINKSTFASAKEKQAEYGEDITLDPGRYNGSVMDVRVPKATLVAIDIKEEESGGRVTIMYSTETEERLVWLLKDLKKFGLDPSTSEEINEALEALKEGKPSIVFSVVSKDGYSNVKIEKAVDDGGEPAPTTAVDKNAGKVTAGAKAGSPKADAKPAKMQLPGKAAKKVEEVAEEIEEVAEPAADEEVTIAPGLKCEAQVGKERVKIVVEAVDEENNKVTVKVISTGKKFIIKAVSDKGEPNLFL